MALPAQDLITSQATINSGTHFAHDEGISKVQRINDKSLIVKLERLEFNVNGGVNIPPFKKQKLADTSERDSKMVDNTWELLENFDNWPSQLKKLVCKHLSQYIKKNGGLSIDIPNEALESHIPPQGFSALCTKESTRKEILGLIAVPPESHHNVQTQKVIKALFLYILALKRDLQIKKLMEWEATINVITNSQKSKIRVRNDVDLEDPPQGFTYITQYRATEGVNISDDPTMGCECVTCNPKAKNCCSKSASRRFTYRDNGKINLPHGAPIYECNKKCKCGLDCRNRVVQRGQTVSLCIFRTSNGCGWGVKALQKIVKGTFISEYIGEVVSHDEADKREQRYLFQLDFNGSETPYNVDAYTYGNVSRFINHSCDPNAGVWAVWSDCPDPEFPRLAIFAMKKIQKNEEITINYMAGDLAKRKSKRNSLTEVDDQQRMRCYCNSKKCRKFLF